MSSEAFYEGQDRISIWFDRRIKKQLKLMAVQQETTFGALVNEACIIYLKYLRKAEVAEAEAEKLAEKEKELAEIKAICHALEIEKRETDKKRKRLDKHNARRRKNRAAAHKKRLMAMGFSFRKPYKKRKPKPVEA